MSISIVKKLVFQNFLSVIVKSCFFLFSVSFQWEKSCVWKIIIFSDYHGRVPSLC